MRSLFFYSLTLRNTFLSGVGATRPAGAKTSTILTSRPYGA